MNAQTKPALRALAALLALMQCISLSAGFLLLSLRQTLRREALISAGETVLPLRMERVREAVRASASAYQFDPDSVLPLVTEEAVRGCAEEAADVFLSLLDGTAGDLPYFTFPGLEDAIREDPLFIERVPAVMRDNVARDQASADIETALARAVLPLRLSLFGAAESLAGDAVAQARQLYAHLDQALRAALIAAALILVLMLLLPLTRGIAWPRLLIWLEGGLGGGALVEAVLYGLLPLLGLSGMAGELSPILSGLLRALYAGAPRAIAIAAVLLALQSFVVIGLCRRALRRKEAP